MIQETYQVRPYLSFFPFIYGVFTTIKCFYSCIPFFSILLASTPNGEVRIKFETLKSLDPEALDIDGHLSQHSMHRLEHFQQQSPSSSHNSQTPVDAIILKSELKSNQAQTTSTTTSSSQSQQQQLQQQEQNQSQDEQNTMIMEIDPTNIKREQNMVITPEIVSMMTAGNIGEHY